MMLTWLTPQGTSLATFFSVWLVFIGFFFVSYEILGHPGMLRWLMRVIVSSTVTGLLCLLLVFLIILFLKNFIPRNYLLRIFDIRNAMYYGIWIGAFYGFLTHSYDVQKQQPQQHIHTSTKDISWHKKVRTFLNDRPALWICVDSFACAIFSYIYSLFYGSIIMKFPFHSYFPMNRWFYYLGTILVGAIGGAYWRLLHRSSSYMATDKPPTFSVKDCLREAMYWFIVGFVLYLLGALVFYEIWHNPIEVPGVLLLGLAGLITGVGSLVIGIISLSLWIASNAFLSSIRKLLHGITRHSSNKPAHFSLRDGFIGLVFWPAIWSISNIIRRLVFIPYELTSLQYSTYFSFVGADFLQRFKVFIAYIAIAGIIAGGISKFICWIVLNIRRERYLGIFGICITVIGFILQSIEPTTRLFPISHGHRSPVLAVAWSPDGKQIASGSGDKTVQVWEATTGKTKYVYKDPNEFPVTAVAWSPHKHNKCIVSDSSNDCIASNSNNALNVWDAADGHYINDTSSNTPITSIAWSLHGQYLAFTGDKDFSGGTVDVWDPQKPYTMYAELTPKRHAGSVNKVAWSPDGNFIAAAYDNGTVLVWKRISERKWENIYTYSSHTGPVNALAWSPDGKRITSAGQDKTVQVWDATTGNNPVVYRKHRAPVNDVAWSPDGKRIASASDDETAQVWNAVKGDDDKNVVTYRGHDGKVRSVAWSPAPGSSHIATASDDDTVQIWDSISGDHILTYGDSGSQ